MQEGAAFRLMAYLFFIHSTMTIIVGYIPVYFQGEGLSNSEVGLLMAIGPIATIIAQPFWGYMSDKYKSIKRMLLIAISGVILSAFLFLFISFVFRFYDDYVCPFSIYFTNNCSRGFISTANRQIVTTL
ncbi:MFS transporter [Bacillus sp. JCM 19034]|uniref:MFS transporter n=1 Tax=Bacillus sp. JCM 19034 TaxID=1481928 RepID=UPI000A472C3B|nr:MFS transporter [Bacillus sp. JCM 19034]